MSRLLSKERVRDLLLGLALLCATLALMLYPQPSMEAAKSGLALCYNVIIPSLFPFFVLSSLVVELGLAGYLGRLLEGLMRPLFHVSGACASAFALGFIGGYPVGAKTAISLYENGMCTKTEAERLLAFCNNSGPAFILGVVGAGVFASSRVGVLLYLAHAAASICIGILFRFYKAGPTARREERLAGQLAAARALGNPAPEGDLVWCDGVYWLSLPADAEIYENNMLSSADALKVGSYARVNLDRKGTAESVRLGGAVTSYTGSVTGVEQDSLTVTVNGASKRLDIDRFTEVQVGKTAGDYTLLDPQAGYTTATCYVDAMGHLDAVQLSGGTRAEEGILVKVENGTGGQRLQVSAFNGETRRYTLPAGAGVTVNGVVGTVSDRYEGDYVSLRVSNDEANELVSMAVDTVTDYVQGSVKSFTYAKDQNDITLTNLSTGKSTTYDISSKAAIRFNGEDIALKELERNSFATLQLSGGDVVTLLDAYPGSTTTEGVIESITYGTPTTLAVKTANDSVMTFELDLTDLPAIYRDGKSSSLDKIKSGDTVVVTVRYNKVTTLETTPQSANVTGTITRVVQDAAGITFDVKLTDGSTASYTVSEGVSVTQDGTAVSLYTLKPNDAVAMVVSGGDVVSIEVDRGSGSSSQLEGTVLVPNTKDKTLMVQLTDGNVLTADVSDASFMSASGSSTSLRQLEAGDRVQLFGDYKGAQFVATLVLKL